MTSTSDQVLPSLVQHLQVKLNAQTESYLQNTPQHFASVLATAALQLMSNSALVEIPHSDNHQLQLRISLYSGPCSAGVVSLQTSRGSGAHIPHYKLFGLSLGHTQNLCMTGLALQVRVSKSCQELLASTGWFKFERCPDYIMCMVCC